MRYSDLVVVVGTGGIGLAIPTSGLFLFVQSNSAIVDNLVGWFFDYFFFFGDGRICIEWATPGFLFRI